jgi:hypothetical protein
MTSRLAQRVFLGATAVFALLVATACDNPVDPPAAKVDDARISRDDLFSEANALASLPGDPQGLLTDNENALDGEALAGVLSRQISAIIFEEQAERMGLELDPAEVDAARDELEQGGDGIPADLLDEYATRFATSQLVQQHVVSEQWWTDEDVERYHELTGEQICVRHILVESVDEAEEVLDELRDGADFGELAEERSIDQGSAASGGDLGCRPRNTYIAEFDDAIEDADSGDLIGPVTSQAGVHVILVDEGYHEVPLEDARPGIEEFFADPQGSGWVEFVLKTTNVDVDPRFGSWNEAAGQVVPPQGAQPAPSTGALSVE